MTFCLISISCLNKAGCSLLIEDQQCIICGPQPKHTVIGSVPLIQGLYRATSSITSPKPNLQLNLNSSHPTTLDDLYCKLRHIGDIKTYLKSLITALSPGLTLTSQQNLNSVLHAFRGKLSGNLFLKKVKLSTPNMEKKLLWTFGDQLKLSCWEETATTTFIIICMYSAEEHITFLNSKSNTFDSYQKYEAWVKKQ